MEMNICNTKGYKEQRAYVHLVVSGLSTFLAVVDCMILHCVLVMVCFVFCFYIGHLFCIFLWAHCAPAFSSRLCAIEISCIAIIIIIISTLIRKHDLSHGAIIP